MKIKKQVWKICQKKKSLKFSLQQEKIFKREQHPRLKVLAVKKENQDQSSIESTAEQVQTQAGAELGQTQP